MARYVVSTAAADPVRPYLEGVAKLLVDRLYGAKGPVWGTRLTAIEDTVKAVRQVLSEEMLAEALQRQAGTVGHEPADLPCCPKCGKEVKRKPDKKDPRVLQTDVGAAHWQEPVTYCPQCRRSFFPSDPEFGDRSDRIQPDAATQDHVGGDGESVVRPG